MDCCWPMERSETIPFHVDNTSGVGQLWPLPAPVLNNRLAYREEVKALTSRSKGRNLCLQDQKDYAGLQEGSCLLFVQDLYTQKHKDSRKTPRSEPDTARLLNSGTLWTHTHTHTIYTYSDTHSQVTESQMLINIIPWPLTLTITNKCITQTLS